MTVRETINFSSMMLGTNNEFGKTSSCIFKVLLIFTWHIYTDTKLKFVWNDSLRDARRSNK